MAGDDDKPTLVDERLDAASAPTLAEPPKDSDLENVELEDSLLSSPQFGQRYALERVLGEGGMGAVYLYRDKQIGRRVALKVLSESRRTSDASARFVREARVQGQLEHPAVVPVYDLGVDPEGAPFFTMKRVRGVTLEEIIEALREMPEEVGRSYSRRRLLTAFSNVCLAVDFAHRHGVLHRDLKPSNIMLGHFGEVYVLDWGLAKVLGAPEEEMAEELDLPQAADGSTMPGALMGTPGYMSPEQLRGEHDRLGPRADIYGLGAILFELLTGMELHPRDSLARVTGSTLSEVEARPSVRAPEASVAPELETVVVRATRLSPERRYGSAREMSEAIERFLDGERDEERRRELASEHARAAIEAAVRSADPEHAVEQRRLAMQSIGRALALDPTNQVAMETMVELLTVPPPRLPPEVEGELDRAERRQVRWVGRIGGFAFLLVLSYLPLAIWAGIESWTPLADMTAGSLGASLLSFATAMTRRPHPAVLLGVMLLSNVGFAATAALWGPLIVTPTLMAINTASFALYLKRGHRMIAVATGIAFTAGIVALGLAGALPSQYLFEDGVLVLTSDAIRLARAPTLVLWTTIAVGAVAIGATVVTRMRDALGEAERRLYLYTWHLREFVPPSARASSDPTRQVTRTLG